MYCKVFYNKNALEMILYTSILNIVHKLQHNHHFYINNSFFDKPKLPGFYYFYKKILQAKWISFIIHCDTKLHETFQ